MCQTTFRAPLKMAAGSGLGTRLGGSCQSAIFAYVILPAWPGPLTACYGKIPLKKTPHCSLRGGGEGGTHISAPRWIRAWTSPNSRWQLRSRHILYMVTTKDLYSAYCPTGGCTTPPFCLSLSTARLLHSYVCPSIIYDGG